MRGVLSRLFQRQESASSPAAVSLTTPCRGHEALDADWRRKNVADIRSQITANILVHQAVKERADAFMANNCVGTPEDAALAIVYVHARAALRREPVELLAEVGGIFAGVAEGQAYDRTYIERLKQEAFSATNASRGVARSASLFSCMGMGLVSDYDYSLHDAGMALGALSAGTLEYVNISRWGEHPYTVDRSAVKSAPAPVAA
jgi:hypothetical protein